MRKTKQAITLSHAQALIVSQAGFKGLERNDVVARVEVEYPQVAERLNTPRREPRLDQRMDVQVRGIGGNRQKHFQPDPVGSVNIIAHDFSKHESPCGFAIGL
ncbi:hypothetical protein D3C78_1655180 [compost metagenome]